MADDRVKQVKEANDVVEVIGGYLALRQVGATFKGLCPFHDDHRPSFDVDPARKRYRCWACGKFGDVISFIQEFEKVPFREALEMLARRAGISLEDDGRQQEGPGRAQLIDVMRWAAQQFHECLLDSKEAEEARRYLGGRGLRGDTVRRWGLGYAPGSWHWLLDLAQKDRVPLDLLETVGIGGRVLPGSPGAEQGPKYYNSSDTPLFSKSEQLYGIDQARDAAVKAGYLAVVEGYTDVLMAHQHGVCPVVATMGTALNERHVRQIRRFVPRVVLVFDADAGGDTGVDRALHLFASHDLDLAVATLPAGLDPCDLIVRDGPEPFRRVLESAVDALEFTLTRKASQQDVTTVEGARRVIDAVLGVIALAPALPGEAGAVKTQLMITRIARRLALKEETVWARLEELRRSRRQDRPRRDEPTARGSGPAPLEERQLLEVLLAEPELVGKARASLSPDEITHPGLRRLLAGLYALDESGRPATLDGLRKDLEGSLVNKAFELQANGEKQGRHEEVCADLLVYFQVRRERAVKERLHGQLQAATDPEAAKELLRQLQRTNESSPDAGNRGDGPSSPDETNPGA